MASITIDGKEYDVDALSDAAKAEIASLNSVDQKLASLQADVAIFQTARNAYVQGLVSVLPENVAHPNKKKDVITVDEKKYALEDFSDEAKGQLTSLQLTEQKIQEAQSSIAITQTARNAYANSLKAQLDIA